MTSLPQPVCLKVEELGNLGCVDLKAYDADAGNARVTRAGRVSVAKFRGRTYNFRASPWANPYVVGVGARKYTLEKSLALYRAHLDKLLADPHNAEQFAQLATKKTIGCYCPLPSEPGAEPRCHRDIILERLQQLQNEREK